MCFFGVLWIISTRTGNSYIRIFAGGPPSSVQISAKYNQRVDRGYMSQVAGTTVLDFLYFLKFDRKMRLYVSMLEVGKQTFM